MKTVLKYNRSYNSDIKNKHSLEVLIVHTLHMRKCWKTTQDKASWKLIQMYSYKRLSYLKKKFALNICMSYFV